MLTRFDPFTSLSRDMNRDWGRLMRRSHDVARGWFVPSLDIAETGDGYVVRAELPGLERDDIDVELKNDVLTISGERSNESESSSSTSEDAEPEAGVRWLRRESSYGRFERRVSLPEGTDPESVSATLENGVLEVTVAKPAVEQPKRIEIQS